MSHVLVCCSRSAAKQYKSILWNPYLVNEALVVPFIAVCHDLDIIALPEECWEIQGYIVLRLNPLVVL